MSYIGGPLPGQEKEEESENRDLIQSYKDRTIGKETIDRTISVVQKLQKNSPEWLKEGASITGHLLKDTYMDVRTLEGKEWLNPVDVVTAGAVRAVEGAAKLTQPIATFGENFSHKVLGIDARGAKFLGIATEIAVTGGVGVKGAKYVKSGAAMADLTDLTLRSADPTSLAGMMYKGGAGVFPVPKKLTKKGTSRLEGSRIFGGQTREARLHYDKLKLVRDVGDKQIASTSTHHMNQLIQQADAVINHPKGDSILKNLRAKKIPVGDDIENYTSIVDWNTYSLRNERVKKSVELYPDIPSKTFNDAFGASDFLPPQLTINEAEQLKLLKSRDPSWTMDRFLEEVKKDTGRKFGTGKYPSIDLVNPDGTKTVWKAKTGKDWDNRWKVINEHYGSNIDPKKLSNIKIDPELATYAPDHGYLHKEILDNLPSHKRLKELQKSGEWKTLSEVEATKLLTQVSQDSFKMSHGISKWRYGQIAEYYEKMKLNSKVLGKLKNKKWNQLPTDIQQEYFKENASKLSSYGSRTIPSMDELLTSTKKLTQKEKNFYGIK